MTDTTDTAATEEVATDDTTPTENDGVDEAAVDEPEDSQHDEKNPNSEAAKYRKRLRDTETERDTLRGRVETLQRAEIERLVTGKLADPSDLWRDGAQLDDVLDDDGNVDSDKVNDLANSLLKAHAHWAAPRVRRTLTGLHSGASVSQAPAAPKPFTAAFTPRGGDER